jgi:hypothetical protein
VIGAGDKTLPVVEDVIRCWNRIASAGVIGLGIAVALGAAGSGALALRATGALLGLSALGGYPLLVAVYLGALGGMALGTGLGVVRVRRAARRQVAYGDLRQRQLADYRSPLLRWLLPASIACQVIVTALVASTLGARLKIQLVDGSQIAIAPSFWTLAVLPALSLLVFVLGEVLLTYLATLPRLLLTRNPQLAQPADNMVRARTICTAQGLVLLVVAALSQAQWYLLLHNVTPTLPVLDGILLGDALLAFALFAGGLLAFNSRGRLGGRLTGWPWRPLTPAVPTPALDA